MSYTLSLSNGTSLLGTAGLADGTVDSTTISINLVGKNYPNYGQLQNENFVHMLEHFANSDEPNNAIPGQIWWDSATKVLKINTAASKNETPVWKNLSTILSTATLGDIPIDVVPILGDFWWDRTNKQLYIYSGDTTVGTKGWVLVGPATSSGAGTTGVFADTITDTTNFKNNVVKIVVNGIIVGIIWYPDQSKYYGQTTPYFDPLIPPVGWGNQSIKPGFNLPGSTSYTNMYYHGTAAESRVSYYADIAERYAADAEYEPGTVVMLGGEKEITQVNIDRCSEVFGVISTTPAYLLNAEAGNDKTHPPVALTGRIPVKVVGIIKRGDRLVSAGEGRARAARISEISPWEVIGRALQSKDDIGPGVIEAVVKIAS